MKEVKEERICIIKGCTKLGYNTSRHRKDGSLMRGAHCWSHHGKRIAERRGCKDISEVKALNAGCASFSEYQQKAANEAGFRSHTEYANSIHPYRKYRKNYCENRDGRLEFPCVFKIPTEEKLKELGIKPGVMPFLDVDHIDGNPSNNEPENLQTLCKNCHSIKTLMNKDYETEGRKTIGKAA
jgi:hypothetical protein